MLAKCGIVDTWYYACPALVLAGSGSCLSISGREYEPANEEIGTTTLITVDLSPSLQGVWGDCARSFFLEDGRCVAEPTNPEFRQGAEVERDLHAALKSFGTPSTTFEELHEFANARIQSLGFENRDFLGNLGHSIGMTRTERLYIEEGNREKSEALDGGLRDLNTNLPKRLNLSEEDKQALEAFLNTFTDTPLLTDPKFSDPFQ